MQAVYLDVLFLVNFLMDYLVLTSTGCILGVGNGRLKGVLAALLGGGYAVFYLLVSDAVVFQIAAGALMVLVFFGFENLRRFVKRFLMFLLMSALFAGCVMLVYYACGSRQVLQGVYYFEAPASLVLATAVTVYLMTELLFRKAAKHSGAEVRRMEVCFLEKTVKLSVLLDNGNDAREVISGKKVLIASRERLYDVLPEPVRDCLRWEKDAVDVYNGLAALPYRGRFRLVPYTAVGVEKGMLLAFQPDWVKSENGKKIDCYVGISPQETLSGDYDALVGR